MIYGIVASEFHVPLPQPVTPVGEFNFVSDTYSWGGTALIASDVTDKTAWIGASGLSVPDSQAAAAELLYSAMATFLADCVFTVVIEVEILSSSYAHADILTIANAADGYPIQLYAVSGGSGAWEGYDYDSSVERYLEEYVTIPTMGLHKVAFSRSNALMSISVDGNSVITVTDASQLPVVGFPMANFYLGGWSNSTTAAINIRSVAFYDLQADADLPGLSA